MLVKMVKHANDAGMIPRYRRIDSPRYGFEAHILDTDVTEFPTSFGSNGSSNFLPRTNLTWPSCADVEPICVLVLCLRGCFVSRTLRQNWVNVTLARAACFSIHLQDHISLARPLASCLARTSWRTQPARSWGVDLHTIAQLTLSISFGCQGQGPLRSFDLQVWRWGLSRRDGAGSDRSMNPRSALAPESARKGSSLDLLLAELFSCDGPRITARSAGLDVVAQNFDPVLQKEIIAPLSFFARAVGPAVKDIANWIDGDDVRPDRSGRTAEWALGHALWLPSVSSSLISFGVATEVVRGAASQNPLRPRICFHPFAQIMILEFRPAVEQRAADAAV